MTTDLYASFADRYDLFWGKFGEYPPVYVEFFRKLFTQNNVHSVLDCACGTGRDRLGRSQSDSSGACQQGNDQQGRVYMNPILAPRPGHPLGRTLDCMVRHISAIVSAHSKRVAYLLPR